jgi:hypothetical protein
VTERRGARLRADVRTRIDCRQFADQKSDSAINKKAKKSSQKFYDATQQKSLTSFKNRRSFMLQCNVTGL